MKKRNKIKINSEEMLKEFEKHGYTRQSMGRVIGCTGRCIGQWLQRGEMPEDLYNDIQGVLNKLFLSPELCGCNINGDLFIYKVQKVWIDLYKYWEDGWNACAKEVEKVLTTEEQQKKLKKY